MREIKFRVWDKEFEETLTQDEGTFQYRDRYDYWVTDFEDAMGNPERFTIMQYTGLKDENGVEIFEGDIVNHYWSDQIGESHCGKVVMRNPFDYSVEDAEYFIFADELEILGNIYENPELLESEAE